MKRNKVEPSGFTFIYLWGDCWEDRPSGDALGSLGMRWMLWEGEAQRKCAGHFGDVLSMVFGTVWCIILRGLGHVFHKNAYLCVSKNKNA